MIRTFSWITLCISFCFGCQSYVDGAKRTLGEVTDDAQITAVVKVRLLNDPEVKGLRINVTTLRGVVMLEGRVPSDYAREKAIRITRETGSVVDVDDRLTVAE